MSPKYAPNFALWNILRDGFVRFYRQIVGEEIKPGDVVYYRTAAVNRLLMEKVLGRDIGNMIYLFCALLVFKRGYKAGCAAEATDIAQHLSLKNGGIALDRVVYEDFIMDGHKPFKNIYAETPKEKSVYKSLMSIVGFTDPFHMEAARKSLAVS